MARQGGQVQLEQSDMRLAFNMAKMAKGGFLHAALEEMQFVIKKPRADVRGENKCGVEFLGNVPVKDAMGRNPAMLREYQTDCCLSCQNGTAQNPQTHCSCKGTGEPPPE